MTEARLVDLIPSHTARPTVIGQGYVSLPLAVEFARAVFPVTGLDSDSDRVAVLRLGHSHGPDSRVQVGTKRRRTSRGATRSVSRPSWRMPV
jgi:UDP-N-acetyl-D-mannosaminuronate dehydrogenase